MEGEDDTLSEYYSTSDTSDTSDGEDSKYDEIFQSIPAGDEYYILKETVAVWLEEFGKTIKELETLRDRFCNSINIPDRVRARAQEILFQYDLNGPVLATRIRIPEGQLMKKEQSGRPRGNEDKHESIRRKIALLWKTAAAILELAVEVGTLGAPQKNDAVTNGSENKQADSTYMAWNGGSFMARAPAGPTLAQVGRNRVARVQRGRVSGGQAENWLNVDFVVYRDDAGERGKDTLISETDLLWLKNHIGALRERVKQAEKDGEEAARSRSDLEKLRLAETLSDEIKGLREGIEEVERLRTENEQLSRDNTNLLHSLNILNEASMRLLREFDSLRGSQHP